MTSDKLEALKVRAESALVEDWLMVQSPEDILGLITHIECVEKERNDAARRHELVVFQLDKLVSELIKYVGADGPNTTKMNIMSIISDVLRVKPSVGLDQIKDSVRIETFCEAIAVADAACRKAKEIAMKHPEDSESRARMLDRAREASHIATDLRILNNREDR